ncbi:MAG: HD domain-containing protein [Gemmatimonadetes bacterium]|nr:HD domain-containing protein [Gemmatimonadota bacterium]
MADRMLRTRVARRVVATFLLAALLPIGVVAGLSYVAVTGQLEDQSRKRLAQLAKSAGMSVVESLWYARTNLDQMVHFDALSDPERPLPGVFRGAALVVDGEVAVQRGDATPLPEVGRAEVDRAGALLRAVPGRQPRDVFVSVAGSAPDEVLWGRVSADSLWSRAFASATLPTTGAVCVFDAEGRPLACGLDHGEELAYSVSALTGPDGGGEVSLGGETHLIAAWDIFLPASFGSDPWRVLVSEARGDVFAPMRTFSTTFPLALVLGISIISLMANVQIRRTMEPLLRLMEGTRRVGMGDLDTPVVVDSDDEFGELAGNFNRMTSQLADQFKFLDAGRDIAEASLSRLERSAVVGSLIEGCEQITPGRRAAVLDLDGAEAWRRADERSTRATRVALVGADGGVQVVAGRELLPRDPGVRVGLGDEAFAALMKQGFTETDTPVELFPLRLRGGVEGALAVGACEGRTMSDVDRARIQSLAARATLGLQGAGLVEELGEMAWGTIRALARAIDAKSHWTAGHSERVVALALALGREMGLARDDLELLKRGGLLHDVGKIGVPASILDHPGRLSDEQFDAMKQHPLIGVRILEPIEAFRSSLPIVRSHHERWDGTGYPEGLRGEEIDPLARILAAADVFDAMVSTRPYREALSQATAHQYIRGEAGSHFDVDVVGALSRVLALGWVHDQEAISELDHAI